MTSLNAFSHFAEESFDRDEVEENCDGDDVHDGIDDSNQDDSNQDEETEADMTQDSIAADIITGLLLTSAHFISTLAGLGNANIIMVPNSTVCISDSHRC